MSLTTPTTKEISDNIIAQLEATLNQTIPLLPKSFLRVLAKALSGVFVLLYKYAGFIFLQIFVRTASINETTINGTVLSPLKEWGRLIGVGDPTAATNAELLIDITVTTQVGSLPSGSQLVGGLNGVTYITLGPALLNSATVQATVRAVSDQAGGAGAGAIGNLSPGDALNFANPLANVARAATVDSQVVTGANAEATEVYRQRVLDRFQKRPQGGAYADYEEWGEETAGIVNIYPYTSTKPGEVDVFAEATVASSGNADGIPTGTQLAAVAALIELDENGLATRRPAGAFVNTFAITRIGFDVVVSEIQQVDNLSQVQADVTTALTEHFLAAEPFVPGLTIPPRKDSLTQTSVAAIVEDIVSAAGGFFSGATLSQSSVQVSIFVLGEGEKAKLSSVGFI